MEWGPWWLALVFGIIMVLYGMFILSLRPSTLLSLAILAGFAFIAGGIQQFMVAGRVKDWKWLFYVGGVLGIIAGIVAFAWPGRTLLVLSVLMSWYLVIGGIFSIFSAFADTKRAWWWTGLLLGILEVVLGLWAIGSPLRQLLLLVNLAGVWMVFVGFAEIFAAFAIKGATTES
jgi:uncharacterized membrane protein HdeD (DUF308 family)